MEVINGNGLSQMFELQKRVIKANQVENLPDYPIDINSKSGQALIKDFTDRFIEELAEAFNSLEQAYVNVSSNNLMDAKNLVKDYNVEIADANHFLLETLVFLGIDDIYLDNALRLYLKDLNMGSIYSEGSPLTSFLKLGHFLNVKDDLISYDRTAFVIFNKDTIGDHPEWSGGHKIGINNLKQHAMFLWEITYRTKMMTNLLKNRKWTVTERRVNEIKLEERLFSLLIIVFQYYNYAGITEQSLFKSYHLKNEIVLNRFKNGY